MNHKPNRKEILEKAISLTCGDRNKQYGEPGPQMGFSEEQYDDWLKVGGHRHTPATRAAIHQMYTKLSRMAHGKLDHMDNFYDLVAYGAIAGENVAASDEVIDQDGRTVVDAITQDFIESYGDMIFTGPASRLIAQGEIPEGVDLDDPRVNEIVKACGVAYQKWIETKAEEGR